MRLSAKLLIVLIVSLVAVTLPAGAAQATDGGPYITLDPDNGVPGMNVTIEGHNFTARKDLDIYYYRDAVNTTRVRVLQVKTDVDGYFEDTFIVPESYTGPHEVLALGANISASEEFTVEPGLTVSPKKGPVSTNVTVEGHGFAKNETSIELRYYLDGNYTPIATDIPANEYGWWKNILVVPSSGKGNHKIDAEGDESRFAQVNDATFEVTPGISLHKSSGSPGENITMTGSGFYPNDRYITILFAGQEVATEIRVDAGAAGNWTKVFRVPEMPKGTYNVTAEGDDTKNVDARNFEIKPGMVLPPGEGYVGMNLTVTGKGFAANKDVGVKYDGSQIVTGETDGKGSFNLTFAVPESRHGARQVTASDAAGNSAAADFTMESDPPDKPEPVSPPDKSRVGFVGRVTPTFQWSEVSDESGVRYDLQVATSANITAAGEFVEPLLSKQGLVGTNYTLNVTEALEYGTYYWIVQAVDRAGNAGDWTPAWSFRAGLLPLWGFIVAIVAIVVLIGALVYFFVRRRRTRYY